MDIPELLLGALIGAAVGAPVGALLRPPMTRLERRARAAWRDTPLLVHVERDPSIIWAGAPDWVPFSMYFRDVLHLPDPPGDRQEWLAWARAHGGVDAYVTQLQVTLQAKTDVAVVIEGVRARSASRPVSEGVVLTRTTGGADLVPRHFRIDLDWGTEPLVTYEEEGGGEAAEVPRMKIAAGDIERFHIWAEATHGWHDWTVELLLLVEGRRMVVPVDDNGVPFRTVGPEGLPHRMNAAGTTEWSVRPDQSQ